MAYGAILNQKPQKKMLPEIIITPLSTLTSVTATSSTGKVYNGTFGNGVWTIAVGEFDTYTISGVGTSETTEVVVDVCRQYEIVFPQPSGSLNDNSWAAIRYASDNNLGESYWAVGDAKQITLDGTIGTVDFNNYNTWVYILGFNHNASLEGNNRIHFGCFRNAENYTSTNNIALVDSYYGTTTSIELAYHMTVGAHSGGWEASIMRTDVLDADATSPNSASANSFLSALSDDLKAALKQCTKYTDNVGNGGVSSSISSTEDWLWLLSEYEVQGRQFEANPYERNYQEQYQYYADGNNKVKYKHNTTSKASIWWLRSVDQASSTSSDFCSVDTNGLPMGSITGRASEGLAPAFCV